MTHLHVRSWFSFGAGASSPLSLAREASRHGQSSLALTDVATLAGAVRHARACQSVGLHAIFGATIEVENAELVFLCADGEGYANLCDLTTGPHPLALKRSHLEKLGVRPLLELFHMPTGQTILVAGAVISRQRPPTAKGFCFLILEDETGRLPTALPPHLYNKFERVLREPVLVVEGKLEAPPEEKRGSKMGVYRSVMIERIWSLDALLMGRTSVGGAAGLPGESPRTAQRQNAA